jgi:hypothetical protein
MIYSVQRLSDAVAARMIVRKRFGPLLWLVDRCRVYRSGSFEASLRALRILVSLHCSYEHIA